MKVALLEERLQVRRVERGDAELISSHRRRMFAEDGRPQEELDAMSGPFLAWIEERLADGRYVGFLVEEAGQVIAGIGLMVIDWPPHFLHPASSQRGYICNVFVEREHRGKGLAAMLMERAEEEFRRRGVTYLVLHASKLGRPVYERLGWQNTAEMAKRLPVE
jgi:GNAT superfamily N-acetyltransferase